MIRSLRSSPELAALLLAGAVLLGAPAAAQGAGSPDAGAQARSILADPRYQTRLPDHEAPTEVSETRDSPGWRPPSVPIPQAAVPVIGAGAFLARIVFIVLLVVVGVLTLGWLVRALWQWTGRGRPGAVAGEAAEAGAAAGPERDPELEDASRLAAEGRHGEAIHALLLAAIHHFAARAHMQVPPSRTSRELSRLLPLGAEARVAFNELVRAVELFLFGGVAAGPEDYERSLARFRSLVRRPA
ncbi:MAG: hypothetical protein QOF89_3162 [Acidobacteriota bacterium]|nr:hypothetical protein [Acidobacteriota bacterium]